MSRKLLFILSAIAATAVCSCAPGQESRSLVVYYSATGTTATVAGIFQEKTGADIEQILPVESYGTDFNRIVQAYQQEMASGTTREIQPLKANPADYDTIYIGTPVWSGNPAGPVETFLKQYDLKGKVIVPFCTFGSGGNTAAEMIQKLQPDAKVPGWYGVRQARIDKADAEVGSFLVGIGVLGGSTAKLPAFSQQRELSDGERAIFDEACSSYQMPLGSPVSVASRQLEGATEYIFKSEVSGFDGKQTVQEIYVTKMAGSPAEFTQVVR